MNFRDEEVYHGDKKGKQLCIPGVNEERPYSILKGPDDNFQRPPISSFEKRPADGLCRLPVKIDNFGAINILPTDKFGAVQEWDNNQSSSFGSTYSRRFENAEESTGSFNITTDNKKLLEDVRGKYHCIESGSLSVNESGLGNNKLDYSTSAATSNLCSSRIYDGPYSSSTTYTNCTFGERTSNDNYDESGGGPRAKRFCDSSRHNAQERRAEARHVHFQSPEPISAGGNASHASNTVELLPITGIRENVDIRTIPALSVSHGLSYNYIEETRLQLVGFPSASGNPPRPQHVRRKPGPSLDLNELPKPSAGEDLSYGNSFSSDDGSFREIRSNYKFASVGRQAYLRQRMEERQRIQDATPVTASLPETHGAERCRHVVSPEDLVWLNVRNYCGMVLDRETGAVLGTAVLFIPTDSKNRKSAWVTSVNTVEGRWEVVIKDSKGEIQAAKLMLTSTAFGLAFFSVRVLQKTFALAFVSMVSGPASLPHRLSVDAERGDQVYVFGYEEPWESEIGKIADIRVRPGKITDAGIMEIVEIDFTKGRLGGSITTPTGFSGGLVARADGMWTGVITGQTLSGHPSQIDFCSAYNVYSFLDEL